MRLNYKISHKGSTWNKIKCLYNLMVIFSFKDVQHHQCLIKTQDRDKLIPKINFEG